MKKTIVIYVVLLFGIVFGQNDRPSCGMIYKGGGRYDDLRMGVGSPADILFVTRYDRLKN